MDNLEVWPAKEQVAKETGISVRTLDRKIAAGELRQEYRPIPHRKPLAVLHPEDVTKLTTVTLKPVPAPKKTESAMTESVPVTQKLYLTIAEAANYSGLPKSYLQRCLQAGVLPGVKIGGWRIRRSDLFRHKAVSVLTSQTKLLTANKNGHQLLSTSQSAGMEN